MTPNSKLFRLNLRIFNILAIVYILFILANLPSENSEHQNKNTFLKQRYSFNLFLHNIDLDE